MTCGGRGPGGTGRQEQNVRDSVWHGVGDRGSGRDGAAAFHRAVVGVGGGSRRPQSFLQEEG